MILSSSALFEEAEERRDPELNFSGKRYVKFIVKGLEKYEKIRQIRYRTENKINNWKNTASIDENQTLG